MRERNINRYGESVEARALAACAGPFESCPESFSSVARTPSTHGLHGLRLNTSTVSILSPPPLWAVYTPRDTAFRRLMALSRPAAPMSLRLCTVPSFSLFTIIPFAYLHFVVVPKESFIPLSVCVLFLCNRIDCCCAVTL